MRGEADRVVQVWAHKGHEVLFRCIDFLILTKSIIMEITYELTQRDFHDSIIAHRNRSKSSKWSYRVLGFIFFLGLGINLVGIAMRPIVRSLAGDFPMVIFFLLGIAFLWCGPRLVAKNQFAKQPSAHGPRTAVLDSGGVHWRWTGGSSDIEWKIFIRILESRDHFLFYSSPACFSIVPKRAMTVEQMAHLRALIGQYLSNHK